LKAYNLTVKGKKIVKISHFPVFARATIFNFIVTPLKPIISALQAKNRRPRAMPGLLC